MRMRLTVSVALGLLIVLSAGLVAQQPTGLVQPAAIVYIGAFRLEEQFAMSPPNHTLGYSNGAIAYYPKGDPSSADSTPGSIFVAGHTYSSLVAEYAIPVPVVSKIVSELPVARVIRPMTNARGGLPQGSQNFILGIAYVTSQDRIYFTAGSDYNDADCDIAGASPGLGSFTPQLTDAQGLWYLGSLHPFTSLRYIMEIPPAYAAQLGGCELATGRYRGWCPEGTNLYASAPWTAANPPANNAKIPFVTLMQFGNYTNKARWSKQHGGANAYRGGAWLTTSSGKSAVLISGIIDNNPGRSHYGYRNHTPATCEANGSCPPGGRGWWTDEGRAAFLLYAPAALIAVANRKAPAHSPQWYAKVDINQYLIRPIPPNYLVTGAEAEKLLTAFDRARGLLYVTESFADELRPVVHVFRVQ